MLKLEGETIVVCLAGDKYYCTNKTHRPEGFITWAKPNGCNIKYGSFGTGNPAETREDCFRLATEKEIQSYKKGIRFIKDISKDDIINHYSIY